MACLVLSLRSYCQAKVAEEEAQRAAKAEALTRSVRERKLKAQEHEKTRAQQLQAKEAQEEAASAATAHLSVDTTRLRRATASTSALSQDANEDAFSMNLSEPGQAANAGGYDAAARRLEYQLSATTTSAGGAAIASPFPEGGLYWSVVGDPAYGEAQPPLDLATAQQYAAQWDV